MSSAAFDGAISVKGPGPATALIKGEDCSSLPKRLRRKGFRRRVQNGVIEA